MTGMSQKNDYRPLRHPVIGIYAGKGTSHSWLWFVDIFERFGFRNLRFVDEATLRPGLAGDLDVVAVSGGDTFSVAGALGAEGAGFLRSFIENGGLYIGACAGAYLPMNSSKAPLNLFNFAPVKITNLAGILPRAETMGHKFCTAYGCRYIFHPVRETVRLSLPGVPPFTRYRSVSAPMYGGPPMTVADEACDILAVYDGFTEDTLFLVDRRTAEKTVIGKAAAVRVPLGDGRMVLFGPHFEHPRFTRANLLVADVIDYDAGRVSRLRPYVPERFEPLSPERAAARLRDLKREVSNARIVAAGLEMRDVRWRIGAKVYEPEKFRVFLDAVWHRLLRLEKQKLLSGNPETFDSAVTSASETVQRLRELKQRLEDNEDTTQLAESIIDLLHRMTIDFLEAYFHTIGFNAPAATVSRTDRTRTCTRPPSTSAAAS